MVSQVYFWFSFSYFGSNASTYMLFLVVFDRVSGDCMLEVKQLLHMFVKLWIYRRILLLVLLQRVHKFVTVCGRCFKIREPLLWVFHKFVSLSSKTDYGYHLAKMNLVLSDSLGAKHCFRYHFWANIKLRIRTFTWDTVLTTHHTHIIEVLLYNIDIQSLSWVWKLKTV